MKNSNVIRSTEIPSPDSVAELLVRYQLDLQAANRSQKTINWYLYILNHYFDFLESNSLLKPVSELGRKELREYVRFLQHTRRWLNNPHIKDQSKGLSPYSIQGHVRAIKTFWTWLANEGIIESNLLAKFPLPKVPQYVIRTLTPRQISQLLSAIEKSTALGYKYYCIILLLVDAGIRISELINIKVNDVDIQGGFVTILGKGQKQRVVPISRITRKEILRYRDRFGKGNGAIGSLYLFTDKYGGPVTANSIQQYLRRLAKKADLGDIRVTPHIFRHTVATHAATQGTNAFILKEIMGHSSMQTTMRDIHPQPTDLKAQHNIFSMVNELFRNNI